MSNERKQAILDALGAFVRQRSGMDYRDYGDVRSYRAEQRSITRDLHHYRELAAYVAMRESITADMLLEASRSAYSGRLTLKPFEHSPCGAMCIDYCTGQFPTEYRRAACAVLASAIWEYWRVYVLPTVYRCETQHGDYTVKLYGDEKIPMSAGDWLRANARREFGRSIAARWFN